MPVERFDDAGIGALDLHVELHREPEPGESSSASSSSGASPGRGGPCATAAVVAAGHVDLDASAPRRRGLDRGGAVQGKRGAR